MQYNAKDKGYEYLIVSNTREQEVQDADKEANEENNNWKALVKPQDSKSGVNSDPAKARCQAKRVPMPLKSQTGPKKLKNDQNQPSSGPVAEASGTSTPDE